VSVREVAYYRDVVEREERLIPAVAARDGKDSGETWAAPIEDAYLLRLTESQIVAILQEGEAGVGITFGVCFGAWRWAGAPANVRRTVLLSKLSDARIRPA
jgi:hypothetical protein